LELRSDGNGLRPLVVVVLVVAAAAEDLGPPGMYLGAMFWRPPFSMCLRRRCEAFCSVDDDNDDDKELMLLDTALSPDRLRSIITGAGARAAVAAVVGKSPPFQQKPNPPSVVAANELGKDSNKGGWF